jgi:hypothetical protein
VLLLTNTIDRPLYARRSRAQKLIKSALDLELHSETLRNSVGVAWIAGIVARLRGWIVGEYGQC